LAVAFNQDTDFVIGPWLSKSLHRRLQKGEAIVGSESAFNIDIGLTEVDTVLFGNMFKMVGILEKTGTGLDTAIFIDEENIADILKNGKADLKPGQTSVIFAKVRKGTDPYLVAGKIEDAYHRSGLLWPERISERILLRHLETSTAYSLHRYTGDDTSAFLMVCIFAIATKDQGGRHYEGHRG
jgi:hypothetical protein